MTATLPWTKFVRADAGRVAWAVPSVRARAVLALAVRKWDGRSAVPRADRKIVPAAVATIAHPTANPATNNEPA